MPDAQAPAPAAAATPPTTTEPQQAAAPEPVKTKAERHAEIKARLAKANQTTEPAAEAKPDGDKPAAAPEAKKPEAEEPKKPAVGAVMRLTAENTKLKGRVEELEGKLSTASKGETVEALRARVKKDPAVLLDVFGADLDEDEAKRIAKLQNAALDRLDPNAAKDRELDERLSALERREKELNDREQERVIAERETKGREHTGKVLTEGLKGDDGTLVIDPAKYAAVNTATKLGLIDAHLGVMHEVRDRAAKFRKENDRNPNDDEIVGIIGAAAAETNAYLVEQAKKWSEVLKAMAPPAPAEDEPAPARRAPTTIGSNFGSRQPPVIDRSRLTKAERHEEIRQRLRRSNQQSTTAN